MQDLASPQRFDRAALGDAVNAAFDWWRAAGVDGDWRDQPQDWLAKPAAVAAAVPQAASSAPSPAAPRVDLPRDFADFADWWLREPGLAPAGAARVPPSGPLGAPLMVLVPMPEAADCDTLLAGPGGRLLDGLLAAAGLSRGTVYCAAALPARITAPDWAALAHSGLGAILTHHVALVRPQRLIVFGQSGISALLDHASPHNPPHLRLVNHECAQIPALATYDLEMVMTQPKRKARLWSRWLDWMPA